MRETIRTAAINAQGDAKDFLSALLLRDFIVAKKYYRQDTPTQKDMCQSLVNDLIVIYDIAPYEAQSRNIFMELLTLKGISWTTAAFAIASPRILMDHKLSYAIVKFPKLFVQAYSDEDMLINLWADCLNSLSDELAGVSEIVRQSVSGHSRLAEIVNDIYQPVLD